MEIPVTVPELIDSGEFGGELAEVFTWLGELLKMTVPAESLMVTLNLKLAWAFPFPPPRCRGRSRRSS